MVSCSGVATRECVGAWTGGTRAQAGHLAPARSERAENPPGLTGRARVTRLLHETDDRTGLSRRHTRCAGRCRAAAVRDSRCVVPSEAVARRDHSANGRVVLVRSCQGGLTARRAEARGTVTRTGRDRASGLGSAKPTRARSRQGRALPQNRHRRHGPPNARHPGWNAGPTPVFRISATERRGTARREGRQRASCEVAGRSREKRRYAAPSSAPPASHGQRRIAFAASRARDADQWNCVEVIDAGGDNSAVERAYVPVVPLVDVLADHLQGRAGIPPQILMNRNERYEFFFGSRRLQRAMKNCRTMVSLLFG